MTGKPAKAPRRGRPRLEDAKHTLKANKPWAKLHMSRATWYRRQLEQRNADVALSCDKPMIFSRTLTEA